MKYTTTLLIALVSLAVLGLGGAALSSDTERGEAGSRGPVAPTLLFLRHAETAASTSTTRDPELSEKGERRADALARLLSNTGVTHLFASEYKRTQGTLGPLAQAMGLEVQVVPAGAATELVAGLKALPPGSVAVVAGHSNTVPQLVAAVGGEALNLEDHPTYGGMLADTAYDRLFLVPAPTFDVGHAATIELCYGE